MGRANTSKSELDSNWESITRWVHNLYIWLNCNNIYLQDIEQNDWEGNGRCLINVFPIIIRKDKPFHTMKIVVARKTMLLETKLSFLSSRRSRLSNSQRTHLYLEQPGSINQDRLHYATVTTPPPHKFQWLWTTKVYVLHVLCLSVFDQGLSSISPHKLLEQQLLSVFCVAMAMEKRQQENHPLAFKIFQF